MSKLYKTTVEGEAFPHRSLWHTAKRQFKAARDCDKGASHFDLAAILVGYLSYEAYLNLLVSELDTEVWSQERTFFSSRGEYPGTEGKLDWVTDQLEGISIDKGDRPYQTIRKAKELRDKLVHGKPYKYTDEAIHTEDNDPLEWPKGSFEEISEDFASIVLHDLEELMEHVHTFALPKISNRWLKAGALKGATAYQTGGTSAAT